MSSEEATNLARLTKSVIPTNFVKKNNGEWNHAKWLEFCAMLEEKGYTPIDFDQVGLLVEKKKADFFGKQKD